MKALLIIAWVTAQGPSQATIPMPDLMTCQSVGASVETDEHTRVFCATKENIDITEGVNI